MSGEISIPYMIAVHRVEKMMVIIVKIASVG
jgi:hypothetical protein